MRTSRHFDEFLLNRLVCKLHICLVQSIPHTIEHLLSSTVYVWITSGSRTCAATTSSKNEDSVQPAAHALLFTANHIGRRESTGPPARSRACAPNGVHDCSVVVLLLLLCVSIYSYCGLPLSLWHEAALNFCHFSGGALSSTCVGAVSRFRINCARFWSEIKLRSDSTRALHNLAT
jgi:hypothetical protein